MERSKGGIQKILKEGQKKEEKNGKGVGGIMNARKLRGW